MALPMPEIPVANTNKATMDVIILTLISPFKKPKLFSPHFEIMFFDTPRQSDNKSKI